MLHFVIKKQNIQMTQLLLEHKADANIQDKVAWGEVDADCVSGQMAEGWGRIGGIGKMIGDIALSLPLCVCVCVCV